TTYRQGVDRITQAIARQSGSGQDNGQVIAALASTNSILDDGVSREALELEPIEAEFSPNAAAVGDITGLLPDSAPTLPTEVGESSSFSTTLALGQFGGDVNLTLDLAPFETPIKALRTAMLGLMGVMFFVGVVK